MTLLSTTEVPANDLRRKRRKIYALVFILFVSAAVISLSIFWHFKRQSPEYSLARLVKAANGNDEQLFNQLVDLEAVTADFLPQLSSAARELYGRGYDSKILSEAEMLVSTLTPLIADRIRPIVRRQIAEQTRPLERVPLPVMVIAAQEYLEIEKSGDSATVRINNAPDSMILMQRRGNNWVITGYKNKTLAREIARQLGEEAMRISDSGRANNADGRAVKSILEKLEPMLR